MAFRSAVKTGRQALLRQQRMSSAVGFGVDLEAMARRPLSSSYAYRAVQDWKPICRDVAHSRGEEIEEEKGSTCMMNMVLIDSLGYRWPIRFRKTPLMRLIDLFHDTDREWFGVRAGPRRPASSNVVRDVRYSAPVYDICSIGNPRREYCFYCAVAVPYEYLDAMAPPSTFEVEWMKNRSSQGIIWPASNLRLACQVMIEDWMDGMTVALPQGDSMVFQMYHQHGGNRDGVDSTLSQTGQGSGYGMHETAGHSYLSGEKKPQQPGKHHSESYRDSALNMDKDEAIGSQKAVYGSVMTLDDSGVPLSKIFWTDDIDTIIRQRDPTWKGRYEFLK